MQTFKNLSLREQFILIFAVVVLLSLSFHSFIWEPLTTASIELEEQLEQEQDDLDWIKQNVAKVSSKASKIKVVKGSFISWLDLRVKKHQLNLSLKRIKPKGNNEVKIWLEQANVKQLMNFLAEVTQYNVQINAIKMIALDSPGIVDVNFVLEKQ